MMTIICALPAGTIIKYVILLAIFLISLIVYMFLKRKPKFDDKQILKRELSAAETGFKRSKKFLAVENGRVAYKKAMFHALKNINYAKRISMQLAYDDESNMIGSVASKVAEIASISSNLKRTGLSAETVSAAIDEIVPAIKDCLTQLETVMESELKFKK